MVNVTGNVHTSNYRQGGDALHARAAVFLPAVFVLLFTWCAAAEEIGIEAEADRPQIYLGESFILRVKVSGIREILDVDLSAIANCSTKSLGSQDISNYSITIINGVMKRQGFSGRVYFFEVTPSRAGDFRAGPVRITRRGETYTAAGASVAVTGVSQQDIVSIAVEASRATVLADEPFSITLRVLIRRLPGRYYEIDPLYPNQPPTLTVPYLETAPIEGLKEPDIRSLLNSLLAQNPDRPGFYINNHTVRSDPMANFFSRTMDFGDPFAERKAKFMFSRREIREDKRDYFEYSVRTDYVPEKEGNYTFGPALFKGNIPAGGDGRNEPPTRDIFAVGPAVTVRVIPPPEENRPECYIGAIGSNLLVETQLDAQTCKVGDPLTLTLTVGGNVQMRNVQPPRLSLQTNLLSSFMVYDDNIQTSRDGDRRRFTYTIRPTRAGTYELPPIDVAFYDANAREYRVVQSQPIPLRVNRTLEVTAAQIMGGTTNNTGRTSRSTSTSVISPALRLVELERTAADGFMLILLLTGPIVFGMALGGRWLWRVVPHCIPHLRRAAAARRATRMLPAGEGGQAAATSAAFIAAIRAFCADRFDARGHALMPDDARHLLAAQGADQAQIDELCSIMERHFNAAFTGASGTAPADTARDVVRLAALFKSFQELPLRTKPRAAAACIPFALLGSLLLPINAPEPVSSEQAFGWQEANSRMAAADTRVEFLEAARIYQQLVDSGSRSGALFFNQGVALMQAGRHDDALEAFLRAERHAGTDAEIERALRTCLAALTRQPDAPLPWYRLVFFWHYGLGLATRMLIACATVCVLFLAWTVHLFWRSGAARFAIVLGLVAAAVLGSSVATSLHQEHNARRPDLRATTLPEKTGVTFTSPLSVWDTHA